MYELLCLMVVSCNGGSRRLYRECVTLPPSVSTVFSFAHLLSSLPLSFVSQSALRGDVQGHVDKGSSFAVREMYNIFLFLNWRIFYSLFHSIYTAASAIFWHVSARKFLRTRRPVGAYVMLAPSLSVELIK